MQSTLEVNINNAQNEIVITAYKQLLSNFINNPKLFSIACKAYECIGISSRNMRKFLNLWIECYEEPMRAIQKSRRILKDFSLPILSNCSQLFQNVDHGVSTYLLPFFGRVNKIADIGSGS